MNRSIAAATLAALLLVPCGDARALAQRTFVSAAIGADANVAVNCAIANPCRSFGAAMTVTLADGEIVVLDSGGYGRVTIDKSVSIVAPPGIYAGISVFAVQDGVNIFTPGITVVLRGLTINGQGGDRGISVIAANVVLHVEMCVISNLKFMGILVSTVGPSVELFVKDTIVRGNGSGIILSGAHATLNRVIVEKNAGLAMQVRDGNVALNESVIARNGSQGLVIDRISAGSSVATISNTVVTENANEGVWVGPDPGSLSVTINRATIGGNGGAGVNIAVSDVSASQVELVGSTIKSNGSDGVRIQRFTGAAASVLTATDNIISGNAGRGILAFGNDIYAIVNRNTITMNTGVGIEQSTSAVVESRGDNVVRGNNFGAAQTAGVITGIPGI